MFCFLQKFAFVSFVHYPAIPFCPLFLWLESLEFWSCNEFVLDKNQEYQVSSHRLPSLCMLLLQLHPFVVLKPSSSESNVLKQCFEIQSRVKCLFLVLFLIDVSPCAVNIRYLHVRFTWLLICFLPDCLLHSPVWFFSNTCSVWPLLLCKKRGYFRIFLYWFGPLLCSTNFCGLARMG